MNRTQRIHYSLAARTIHTVLVGAFIIGLVALIVGLSLYTYALAGQYIGTAFNLTRNAKKFAEEVSWPVAVSDDVMGIYHDLTEDERAEQGTEIYKARYAEVLRDRDYAAIVDVLETLLESSDVNSLFLAMYDEDHSRLVYIADGDPILAQKHGPGFFETVGEAEVRRFMNWDGQGRKFHFSKEGAGLIVTCGIPIQDQNGRTAAFILSDVTVGNVASGMKNFVLQYLGAMILTIAVVTFFVTRHMKKALVTPINEIASAAAANAEDRRNGTPGAHFSALNIRTGDEIENLAFYLKDMEEELTEYEADLTRATAEQERIGTELTLAARIQASMLPSHFPAFPDRKEMDIYATMTPAKEVGGDFYDFFLIDDDHLGLVIADVSGKGIPAALFMMASRILIRNTAMSGKSPKEVLTSVNESICRGNPENMFVTVWFGVLTLSTGCLAASSAGHECPVIRNAGGSFEIYKDRHGFVLGGMPGSKYTEYEIQMAPGAALFVYTDGLTEATDAEERPFGKERMLEALRRYEDGSAAEIINGVHKEVGAFVKDTAQFDDLTMLCLKFNGKEKPAAMKEISVPARLDRIEAVTEFVTEALEALDCPMKAVMQVSVAIDELFGNIAQYAYGEEEGEVTVRVQEETEPKGATVTFIDSGIPFDPLAQKEPDVTLSAEEREIGGLGIFLVKKTMDEVNYRYEDGKNILSIRKHF